MKSAFSPAEFPPPKAIKPGEWWGRAEGEAERDRELKSTNYKNIEISFLILCKRDSLINNAFKIGHPTRRKQKSLPYAIHKNKFKMNVHFHASIYC